jgi:hypothetical protein
MLEREGFVTKTGDAQTGQSMSTSRRKGDRAAADSVEIAIWSAKYDPNTAALNPLLPESKG